MSIRACKHIPATEQAAVSKGCDECLALGDSWVHLRLCVHCGHVGCCDSSKNKHATRHFASTGHPVMRSLEAGENWAWCYAHQRQVG